MMAYARSLVHLDTREGLQEHISLQWRNLTRLQTLDYEGVPSDVEDAIRLVTSSGTTLSTIGQRLERLARHHHQGIINHKMSFHPLERQRPMLTLKQPRRHLQRRPRRSAPKHLISLPLLQSPGLGWLPGLWFRQVRALPSHVLPIIALCLKAFLSLQLLILRSMKVFLSLPSL